jgi:eukaryotic-like serine/threonine-protein kinase
MSLEGQQLGRYHLYHLLGSGGMGEVYLATDPSINRQVAVKVIREEVTPNPDATASQEAARLFEREMRAIAILDHPHILPLFDYGEEGVSRTKLIYMVMPYRKEGSLADWLHKRNSSELLSPQDVGHLVHQAASALQHAHNHQIIHQDVKPSNFLIRSREEQSNRPNVQLADFGVAKFTSATANTSQAIRGTPTYMAPEQWEGHPTPASDQYALAVMAYELLIGRPPFKGGLSQMMYQHFHTPPPPPSTVNPLLPRELDVVLQRALAKKPEERFASISAFAQAFRQTTQSTDAPSVAPNTSSGADIRATLVISEQEALTGTSRTLTLPGEQQVTIVVPAGTKDGQIIHLQGLGEPTSSGGMAGALILTLVIQQSVETDLPSNAGSTEQIMYPSNPNLQPSPVLAPNSNLQRPVTPSLYPPSRDIPARYPISRGNIASRLSLSKAKSILLIGLALLLVAGSTGLFYVVHANRVAAANNVSATATAIARNATGTARANATATFTNPYSGGGALTLLDPLRGNSKGYGWDEGTNKYGGNCQFSGGAYHVSESDTRYLIVCGANSTNFSNFTYEVQMQIIKGGLGGIMLRAVRTNNEFKLYLFGIDQTGYYSFLLYTDGLHWKFLKNAFSPAIKQGLNQDNLIAVVAQGSAISFYVNHQQVDSVNDSAYTQGQIGFFGYPYNVPIEVAFSNARVWTL